MVKTWDDSWFAEQGTRVLYTLPQQWTDGVLPLAITPAPKEVRRVFVGRAELITPAMEWALLREVVLRDDASVFPHVFCDTPRGLTAIEIRSAHVRNTRQRRCVVRVLERIARLNRLAARKKDLRGSVVRNDEFDSSRN